MSDLTKTITTWLLSDHDERVDTGVVRPASERAGELVAMIREAGAAQPIPAGPTMSDPLGINGPVYAAAAVVADAWWSSTGHPSQADWRDASGEITDAAIDAGRPLIYREAAARLHELCGQDGHGGDCPLICGRGNAVLLLEDWAHEMETDRG